MSQSPTQGTPVMPAVGCLGMAAIVFLLCLMPFIFVEVMTTALERLHLDPRVAVLAVVGIFVGGMVNIPIHRIERHTVQIVETAGVYGLWGWTPRLQRVRQDTIVAVNLGGCVIPLAIALWELLHVLGVGGWPVTALMLVTVCNVLVCFMAAKPVQGIGIMMPGFLSPLAAVSLTWLLMMEPQYAALRAPVAFVAGVTGPVVGADLLHLRDITKVSAGMLSIGGAGTFDGIVLSGILAALLA